VPEVRTGQTPTKLTKEEYLKRWRQHFCDPAFEQRDTELDTIAEIAWKAYDDSRKAPRTRRAGPGFADPSHELRLSGWKRGRR
jgi:hypothetical protein